VYDARNREVAIVPKILVICGSVRPTRICLDTARWVIKVLPREADIELELVDLADWPLPMDDEPGIPARDPYVHEHTRAWSRKVAEAAAYIFVTPQYNWGYPAALKNALDHLYREWATKPAMIVSYGFHGGGKCAAQLREVLEGLHMRPAATRPALTLPSELKHGASADIAFDAFTSAIPSVEQAFAELRLMLGADQSSAHARL
jgi:NAD(P)H-dependent FMN reductase